MNGKIRAKWNRASGLWDLMCRGARGGHIPRIRQALESAYPWVRSGVRPNHHTWAALYRLVLTWREICEHTGARRYLHRLSKFNSTKHDVAVSDEIVTHGLPGTIGIPTGPSCQAAVFVYERDSRM